MSHFFPSFGLCLASMGLTSVVAGCASLAPPELVQARTTYQRAVDGPAAQENPADLRVAQNSLAQAERRFKDEGDTVLVRDQAYIATRKAELAEIHARTAMLKQGIMAAGQQEEVLKQRTAARTQEELARTKEQLTAQQSAAQQAAAEAAAKLDSERKQREDAEKRAAQASADLARIAAVKQEDRGTVITLSGSVLFASNKYELLPAAQVKLNQVAEALLAGDPDTTFVVEGHTDSQGKVDSNQLLSQNRSKAVRDYLVSHGIAADRITSEGFGSARPVADNKSAEGRADNRRVEIVVKPGPRK